MARPKKNNADYFSHDNNMRSDTKIQAVRSKFGNDGYAIWNMLLEVLVERDNFQLSIKNATQWEILAGDFRIDTEKLKEIIAYFIKLELIIKDGTNLICPNLSKRLEPLLEIREKKREWRENKEKGVKDGTNEVKDIPNPIRPDLNALKESKVKESKGKREESVLRYLLSIPSETTKELTAEFSCTEGNVKEKGKELYDYCLSKGKVYKDYGAFLRNAIRRDYADKKNKSVYYNAE